MIQIENVSKNHNMTEAIKDVSLLIKRRKITAIIGPNGAGKSTLLSLMGSMVNVTCGRICINGMDVSTWKPNDLAKVVSRLKQSNHLNVRLTVRELVSFGRYPYCKGRLKEEDAQKVDAAIAYLELGEIQDKYIDELSGGQRQRTFIAMVLAQDTDYIFLDEPLNNLDMKHSVQVMKFLRKITDELGKTVVVVIHDINFASYYSDEIIAIKAGQVVTQGPVNEVITTDVLQGIFEMDFTIQEVNGRNVCVYY